MHSVLLLLTEVAEAAQSTPPAESFDWVALLVMVGVLLLLVTLNGVYVAAEFAMVGVSKPAIDALADEGHGSAKRVQALLAEPRRQDRYIAATQLGVTFASLGLGMYGEKQMAEVYFQPLFAGFGEAGFWSAHLLASLLAILILTFLHVVIGEMVPKSIALARPQSAMFFTFPVSRATRFFLLPLVVSLEFCSNRILKLCGVDRSEHAESAHHTEEDLLHIVKESQQEGELRGESGRALAEMFDFSSLGADDVMVARVAMHALEIGDGADQIGKVLSEGQHTRYPVYEEDLDQIIGMVHIRDLLDLLQRREALTKEQVRPISFVPESMTLDRVLGVMRKDRTHAVIVMDEHGGTAGMLTVKDLFEEVVGTIEEGGDFEGRIEAYRDEEGRLHVHGTLRVAELAEVLDRELPETEAESISGLVLLELGRPAKVGDMVRYGPVRLVVIAVEGRGVKECLVQGESA